MTLFIEPELQRDKFLLNQNFKGIGLLTLKESDAFYLQFVNLKDNIQ